MNLRRRKPNRLKDFDYSQPGWYFVTICTKNRINHFGEIRNDKMILNEFGRGVDDIWLKIPMHYPNAELDEFIIMPNHVHGIIIIDYKNNYARDENIRPHHKTNLSNVIKGFKIGVQNWCRNNNYSHFKWQRSFHDRIIRNENELYYIRRYIKFNPLKWSIAKNLNNIEI